MLGVRYSLFVLLSGVAVITAAGTTGSVSYQYCASDINSRLAQFSDRQVLVPPSTPTVVNTGINIVMLKGINDEEEKLTMTILIWMQWQDWRIASNDLECRKTSSKFVVEATKYLPWYPHFTIANSADVVLYEDGWRYYPSLIYANGTVRWIQEYQTETICSLNLVMFPFDNQFCTLELTAPHYNLDSISFEVEKKEMAVRIVQESSALAPVWSLVGQNYEYNQRTPGISFQRRPSFYLCALMLPTFVINIMTAGTFLSTPQFEEKPQTAQSCLLAYLLLNLVFYAFVPTTSNSQPYLIMFFGIQNFLALGCFFAVAMIYRTDYVEAKRALEKSKKNNGDDDDEQDKKFFEDTKAMNDFFLISYLALVASSYLATLFFFMLGAIRDGAKAYAQGFRPPEVVS